MSYKLTGVRVACWWNDKECGEWIEKKVYENHYDKTLFYLLDDLRDAYDADKWCEFHLIYTNENDDNDSYRLEYNENSELTDIVPIKHHKFWLWIGHIPKPLDISATIRNILYVDMKELLKLEDIFLSTWPLDSENLKDLAGFVIWI